MNLAVALKATVDGKAAVRRVSDEISFRLAVALRATAKFIGPLRGQQYEVLKRISVGPSNDRNKLFLDPVSKLGGQLLSVRIYYRLLPESDDGGITPYCK